MPAFTLWLKKQAEIVTGLGILLGSIAAIIVFFGGNIPPWQSIGAARAESANAAMIQKETVETLAKLNDKIDTVTHRIDQGNCSILNATLTQATAALMKAPNDSLARALRDGTVAQMHAIPGCVAY